MQSFDKTNVYLNMDMDTSGKYVDPTPRDRGFFPEKKRKKILSNCDLCAFYLFACV